jgi:hypothetical protein
MKTHVNRHSCSNTRQRCSNRYVMRGRTWSGTVDGMYESPAGSEPVKEVQGMTFVFLCGCRVLRSVRSDFVLRWGPWVGSCKKKR